MAMRSALLVLLVLGVERFPFRLLAVVAETLVVSPGIVRTRADQDRYWDAQDLQRRLELRYGYTIEYVEGMMAAGNLLGRLEPRTRRITIDRDLGWTQRYAVLAHEGAHAVQPARLTTNQEEVFADLVGFLVLRDGLREHARYLASMRADVVMTALAYWPEMYRAAAMLKD